MKKTILFITVLILTTACGQKKKSSTSLPPAQNAVQATPELEVTQKETVNFIRKEQMVSRYDCDGKIISRKLETQNSLTQKIKINYDDPQSIYEVRVVNRKSPTLLIPIYRTQGVIKIDYASNPLNTKVRDGINELEYTLYRCSKMTDGACNEVSPIKEAVIEIDVYYSAETIPGEQHIHPFKILCEKQI